MRKYVALLLIAAALLTLAACGSKDALAGTWSAEPQLYPHRHHAKAVEHRHLDHHPVGDNITTIGGIIGDIVSIKDDSIVIETTTDRVRVEFAKFAVSTNNTAEKEAAKKRTAAAEARKQAKADKKKK